MHAIYNTYKYKYRNKSKILVLNQRAPHYIVILHNIIDCMYKLRPCNII